MTLSTINHKNLINYCTLLYTIVKNMVYLRIKILVSGANLPFYNFNQFIIIRLFQIISYLLTTEKGKKREKNTFFVWYILTKKEKKGKNLFCFVCMILLLIYMCLCLVSKMNCMYTWWVDCSMSYVNCFLIVPSCCWRGFV